jgi:hypothetical protein
MNFPHINLKCAEHNFQHYLYVMFTWVILIVLYLQQMTCADTHYRMSASLTHTPFWNYFQAQSSQMRAYTKMWHYLVSKFAAKKPTGTAQIVACLLNDNEVIKLPELRIFGHFTCTSPHISHNLPFRCARQSVVYLPRSWGMHCFFLTPLFIF